jgi:hypothetical protein
MPTYATTYDVEFSNRERKLMGHVEKDTPDAAFAAAQSWLRENPDGKAFIVKQRHRVYAGHTRRKPRVR